MKKPVTLQFVMIPSELFQLGITSKAELSILALVVTFGDKGLIMSNADLAKVFNVKRDGIIRVIQRLKRKGYIINAGADDFHRKLVVNSSCAAIMEVLQPVAAEHQNSSLDAPQIVAAEHQSSSRNATHNRIKEIKKKEEKVSGFSSKIDWDKIDRYNQAYKEGRYEPM